MYQAVAVMAPGTRHQIVRPAPCHLPTHAELVQVLSLSLKVEGAADELLVLKKGSNDP